MRNGCGVGADGPAGLTGGGELIDPRDFREAW